MKGQSITDPLLIGAGGRYTCRNRLHGGPLTRLNRAFTASLRCQADHKMGAVPQHSLVERRVSYDLSSPLTLELLSWPGL